MGEILWWSPFYRRVNCTSEGLSDFAQISMRKSQVIPSSLIQESKHANMKLLKEPIVSLEKNILYIYMHKTIKSQQKGMWDQWYEWIYTTGSFR